MSGRGGEGAAGEGGEAGEAGEARALLAGLGPFFAAQWHDPSAAAAAPWRSMGELIEEPELLAARVRAVRGHLAAGSGVAEDVVEVRVAASVMHLGLAARLLSPLFAVAVAETAGGTETAAELTGGTAEPTGGTAETAAAGRRVGAFGLRELWWQAEQGAAGSMFPLSLPELGAGAASGGLGLGALDAIGAVAGELCDVTRQFGVSGKVLWGNVASALNGARMVISAARPEYADSARDTLTALLKRPQLADTGRIGAGADGRFQRRNCCLIYRAAPDRRGALCGDCVLIGRMSTR